MEDDDYINQLLSLVGGGGIAPAAAQGNVQGLAANQGGQLLGGAVTSNLAGMSPLGMAGGGLIGNAGGGLVGNILPYVLGHYAQKKYG